LSPDQPDQLPPSSASLKLPPPTHGTSCSALRFALTPIWPRLTSARASQHLAMSVAPRHPCRSPRVLRIHLHAYACRIYVAAVRASFGLHRYLPAHPATPPPIRFLFVRPALCL